MNENGEVVKIKPNEQGLYEMFYCSMECKAKVVDLEVERISKFRSIDDIKKWCEAQALRIRTEKDNIGT